TTAASTALPLRAGGLRTPAAAGLRKYTDERRIRWHCVGPERRGPTVPGRGRRSSRPAADWADPPNEEDWGMKGPRSCFSAPADPVRGRPVRRVAHGAG